MIKTRELMLGNWVYAGVKTQFPMQVVGVFDDVAYLDFEGNEGDCFEYKEEEMFPVPITEEILLKNGFEKSQYYPNGKYYRYIYSQNKRHFEILNHVDMYEAYNYIGEEPTFDVGSFYLGYVHQLQCLLNLARIDIDFKI